MSRMCNCGVSLEGPGNPRTCQSCKDAKALAKRTKTCAYRNCQNVFVDETVKSCTQYCSDTCSHREKMFRVGKAVDLSYFRSEKPKLESLCLVCRERYESFDEGGRCQKCRTEARSKICKKCRFEFVDPTLKNTRRYCDDCC